MAQATAPPCPPQRHPRFGYFHRNKSPRTGLLDDVMRSFPFRVVRGAVAILVIAGAAACGAEQALREAITPTLTPHERYAKRLRDAGLDSTAIGSGWLTAADSAIRQPL